MAKFCVGCGSSLKAGARFCEACGAPVKEAVPAVGQAASMPQPAVVTGSVPTTPGSSGSLLKIILVVAGLCVLLLLLAMASCGYMAYRAKKKAEAIQQAYQTGDFGDVAKAVGVNQQPASAPAAKPAAPYGWTEVNGKLVPAPPPAAPKDPVAAPVVPVAAVGDPARDWSLKYERTENGPEADLVVRTGDINNLGFGWPKGFDPFSGQSTPPHQWPDPNNIPAGAPDGTDRIMIGSAVTPGPGDGYSGALGDCALAQQMPNSPSISELQAKCQHARKLTMPTPIVLSVGALPANINAVLVQMFVDDFQPMPMRSHFQVSLNGTRIPGFEYAINALDQSGPIGKLLSLKLLPEYWPLLKSGEVKLLFDDPTTHVPDGYAIDFVRILVNPHNFKYQVSLAAAVTDADKHTPIAGATVTAALQSAATDQHGKCELGGLPAGLVVATGAAPGYDENSVSVDLVAGQSGNAEIQLHRHEESAAALERAIEQTGSVAIYGIHFDTDSAKLRADSMPALNAVLELINKHPGSRWVIAGHTDNQGNDAHNQPLSESRANSVIAWLKQNGVDSGRLVPQGFGATRPVADNGSASGRALNRRVEVAIAK